jgi:hypothetical protein
MQSPLPPLIVGRHSVSTENETITTYIVRCPICAEEFSVSRSSNLNERISNFSMCPDCRNSSGRREAIREGRTPGTGFEVTFQSYRSRSKLISGIFTSDRHISARKDRELRGQ